MRRKKIAALFLAICLVLSACGAEKNGTVSAGAPEIEGLVFEGETGLDFAEGFRICRYEGGYRFISIENAESFLVVPEGMGIPAGAEEMTVIERPLENVYLAASSAMSLISAVGALGSLRFSSTKRDGWYIEAAANAMDRGELVFAGKYSDPDYELLIDGGCTLAIENTMLLHSPETREKLEELGITVITDRSSYEPHALGRTEWIKLYGALFGFEEQAEAVFARQAELAGSAAGESTGKTVAFFYVTSAGTVSVRKSADYVAEMIALAGGEYIFSDLGDSTNASSGVSMTMEEFYASAKDADCLIYNATIDSPLNSVDDLIEKSGLFADFKAVQNGNVWCTEKYMYQATDVIGGMVNDLRRVFSDTAEDRLDFMYRLF